MIPTPPLPLARIASPPRLPYSHNNPQSNSLSYPDPNDCIAMWKFYALLSALFAALTAIFAKIGVAHVNAGELKGVGPRTWIFLILSGLATGLSWIFYFHALQTGEASRVAPIDKLSVVFTILLAFLILREPLTPRVILGGVLIAAGSIVMIIR